MINPMSNGNTSDWLLIIVLSLVTIIVSVSVNPFPAPTEPVLCIISSTQASPR